MKRILGCMLAVLAVLGTASCAGHRTEVADCRDFFISPSAYGQQFAGRPGQESQQELNFICQALMYGRGQVTYARMAQQRSGNPAVKEFASQVIDAQGQMNERIHQIAVQQEGVTPPRGLDAPHLAVRDQLAQLSGNAFDRAYLQSAAEDSRLALAFFHKEASTREPVMGQFAANALPVLQQRVTQAQGLAQQSGY
jgi:putative membrane protein